MKKFEEIISPASIEVILGILLGDSILSESLQKYFIERYYTEEIEKLFR